MACRRAAGRPQPAQPQSTEKSPGTRGAEDVAHLGLEPRCLLGEVWAALNLLEVLRSSEGDHWWRPRRAEGRRRPFSRPTSRLRSSALLDSSPLSLSLPPSSSPNSPVTPGQLRPRLIRHQSTSSFLGRHAVLGQLVPGYWLGRRRAPGLAADQKQHPTLYRQPQVRVSSKC